MMTMIKCLAIDDEPIALEKLTSYISKVPFLELVSACESAFEAMEVMVHTHIDIVFLDINMPDLNGMDFISSLPKPPMVVFTTAYSEYAVESYKVSAVDYLLKPYDFASFQRAANKVQRQYLLMLPDNKKQSEENENLYVKVDYRYVNIKVKDILYIKGMSEYVQIFMCDRKPLMVLLTMKQALERLPDYFLQVHRSYIVNMNNVEEVDRLHLRFSDGASIAVSDNCKKQFLDYLRQRTLEKS